MNQVFISHSHADRKVVEAIAGGVRAAGHLPWVSTEEIGPADAFTSKISRAIASARALVVVQTKKAVERPWVLSEVRFALANRVPVIVAEIDRAPLNSEFSFIVTQASATISKKGKSDRTFVKALGAAIEGLQRKLAPVVAVLNAKGGVGKTSVSANVFLAMAMHPEVKARVLLIDLDPQHNLSQLILPEGELDELQEKEQTLSAAFEPGKLAGSHSPTQDYTIIAAGSYEPPPVPDLRWHIPHPEVPGELDLICGDVSVGKYTLPNNPERLQVCKERFMRFVANARSQYDVVVIDCNPSFSFLTMCAIETATHTLSPVTPDVFAARGLYAFRSMIDALYPDLAPSRMILMNRVTRNGVSNYIEDDLRSHPVYGRGMLKARLAESKYMSTSRTDAAPEHPLDTLARLSKGNYAAEMHSELDAAALEVADRLGLLSRKSSKPPST